MGRLSDGSTDTEDWPERDLGVMRGDDGTLHVMIRDCVELVFYSDVVEVHEIREEGDGTVVGNSTFVVPYDAIVPLLLDSDPVEMSRSKLEVERLIREVGGR